jgi:surface polysaccharide O-acyltransferase-like enzyme
MSTIDEKKYNFALDLLRIVSIFSVVIIHVTTKSLELAKYDLLHSPLTLFFNQSLRFAVPIFFLISAFVLELNYPKNFSYLSYIKKRFSRLFLPYLLWSLIYYFFVYTGHSKSFIANLLLGDSSYQLYFIPTLFIFYLFFPLLHKYYRFFINKFVIFILILFQVLILSVDYYFHPLPLPYPISVFFLNFCFFVFGITAYHYQKNLIDFVKKYQVIFYIIIPILSLFITWEGKSLYLKTSNYLSFYSQWRPSIFIYSLFVASIFFYLFNKINININLVKKIASYSFFVYFIHVIFIEIVYHHLPNSLFLTPIIPFLIVLFSSYLTAYLFSKIPHLSKFTG